MNVFKAKLFAATTCLTIIAAQIVMAGSIHDVAVGPNGLFVFAPSDIVVELGDTVRWTWEGDGHNVGSGIPGSPTKAFLSGPPADAGTVFEVVFDQNFLDENPIKEDFYDYHCHPHGNLFGMVGSIQVVTPPPPCPWDLDDSGEVGTSDLLELFTQWGTDGSADFDESGTVDTSDLLILFAYWGPCP